VGLNGCEPRKVSVRGPYTFTIGDTTGLGEYKTGGIFTQVKMPKILEFVRASLTVYPYLEHDLIWTTEISPRIFKFS
jgi:ubiquitin-activating enzyme E1-like protein